MGWGAGFRVGHSEESYAQMIEHFEEYTDVVGDHPVRRGDGDDNDHDDDDDDDDDEDNDHDDGRRL